MKHKLSLYPSAITTSPYTEHFLPKWKNFIRALVCVSDMERWSHLVVADNGPQLNNRKLSSGYTSWLLHHYVICSGNQLCLQHREIKLIVAKMETVGSNADCSLELIQRNNNMSFFASTVRSGFYALEFWLRTRMKTFASMIWAPQSGFAQ